MGISFGGLATGLDTKSIVDQLMSIESRPKTKLEWNKALWESRKTSWNDLNSRLLSLQGHADALKRANAFAGFSGVSSSDATFVSGSASGPKPAAGKYQVEVSQLATTEVWNASAALPAPTSGARETGAWRTLFGNVDMTTQIGNDSLVDNTNLPTGLGDGSTITMRWSKGGQNYSSSFNVAGATTMGDLVNWVKTQVGADATVALNNGKIQVTSAPGTAKEITALGFEASNSSGTSLTRFNGMAGAQSSSTVAATDGGAAQADTLQIVQGANTWYVNVAAGDNEAAIANKINGLSGIGVLASVNGGKLQLAAKESGAAQSFAVTSSGSLATDLGLAEATAGRDATFTVNGTGYTRSKNSGLTDVITDVTLNLLQPTAGSVELTVGEAAASTDEMKKRITDFVNQYNAVVDFVASKTGEKKASNPKNLGEYLQGNLSRDFGFSSVAFELRKQVGDVVQGLPQGSQMLKDIGIDSTTSGKLVVDEEKLAAALNNDPQKVKDIFAKDGATNAEDGIARRLSEMVSQLRVGGRVDSAVQGASAQVANLQGSIDRFSKRLDMKRAYFERMFSSLEASVGRMQSQGSWLSGQLANLR